MPKLDGTGPEETGSVSGRGLGRCSDTPEKEKLQKLGTGMGARRKTSAGKGAGKGKRLNSGKQEQ